MLSEHTLYFVYCDGRDGGCVSCTEDCEDEIAALEEARESGWTNVGKKWFCPDCSEEAKEE